MIYLDNAATSYIKPSEVKTEVYKAVNLYTANPGRSGHNASLRTAEKVYEARSNVKKFLNAENYSLIFTKNCTEALNLAIFSTLKPGDEVITSCYEHNSILRPLKSLEKVGVKLIILDCDLTEFHLKLKEYLSEKTKMIICTMVSNVTGEYSNVKEIGNICKENKIVSLIDGAQACGHVKIDLEELNIDMFAFAGHKGFLSLTGVGGLLVNNIKLLTPRICGGTGTFSENLIQPNEFEEDFEAGTLSSISIMSLGAGINFLQKNFKNILEKEEKLSKKLYFELKKLEFLKVYSKEDSKNVFSFNFKNLDSMTVSNILNEKFNIAVRGGLHCAPLVHKKLKTLESGAVRVSIDFNNNYYEIEVLINSLKKINNMFSN